MMVGQGRLEDEALATAPLLRALAEQCCTSGVLEDLANALAGLCGALEVAGRTNFLGDSHALWKKNGQSGYML